MAQPVPDKVISTPSQPGQPYDSANSGSVGSWAKLPGGPVNAQGRLTGSDWGDSGVWRQC
jgi:hypothetical protein